MQWAKIKFIHSIPGAEPLDIHLDHAPLVSNIIYKAISPAICFAPGSHVLQVYHHQDVKTPILDYDVKFENNKEYTILIVGDNDDPRTTQITIYEDGKKALTSGTAGVRFIHGASAVTALDIYNNNIKIIDNLEYNTRSDYFVLSTNEQTYFAITNKGSMNVILGPIVLKLKSGEYYTLVLTGIPQSSVTPLVTLLVNENNVMCLTL
jgi:hypothetical protein